MDTKPTKGALTKRVDSLEKRLERIERLLRRLTRARKITHPPSKDTEIDESQIKKVKIGKVRLPESDEPEQCRYSRC
jgi:hypothetical protein